MHDSLFLPRELFSPAPPAAQARPMRANRVAAAFASGDAVATDLMNGMPSRLAPFRERRRQPRSADAIGVDLHLGDRGG